MTSQVYEPKGYLFDYVPGGRVPEPARASRRQHAHRVDRVAVEPAAERRRHPRGRRRGARSRRDPRRRQHVRDAVPAAAARARRRRRRALDDEVSRRPLRHRRRLRRDERPDDRRAPLLPAEVARRRAGPVRLVARAARDQDARRAHAPALRERDGDRASGSSGTATSSAFSTRACRRIRSHALAARQMRDFGGMVSFLAESEEEAVALVGAHEALPARRVARRRREPDRGARADDARVDGDRAVRRAAEPRAPVGRHRVRSRI